MQYPTSVPLTEFSDLAKFVMGGWTGPKQQLIQDVWTCLGYGLSIVAPVPAGAAAAAPMSDQDFDSFVKALHTAHASGKGASFTIPPGLIAFLFALLKKLLGIP